MTDNTHYEQRAQDTSDRAVREHASGRLESAIELMREAVVLFAAADSAAAKESDARVLSRAIACRMCGDFLSEGEQYAESANIYQQAVDQYSRLHGEEAEVASRRCAGKLLECISMLRARPFERLNLLIARYEHMQRQFAAQPSHERQQADCAEHIARILARRERYEPSLSRYQEAIGLFTMAGEVPEVSLAIAECHHRMAGLLAHRLNDKPQAMMHYREAIALYALHEPYTYGKQEARALCEQAMRELGQRKQ